MKSIENKPLLFLGDHHGSWGLLFDKIKDKNISNCNLVSVGDVGIGFQYKKEYEKIQAENINSAFEERGINFYGIRGNHDDPYFFSGENRICLPNFELLEDYTVLKYKNKKIQFIGGAISIDREARVVGKSYWKNEGVVFLSEKCEKVDILVTHTAPSFCFPQQFNELVYGWARNDAYLLDDLNEERVILDAIFKLCDPEFHFYGHFHTSWFETINKCSHYLLEINEIRECQC